MITWGPKVATFRTKTLNFSRVIHLNWLAKFDLRGPGPSGRQGKYYSVVHVYWLYAKMLKESEKTLGLVVLFFFIG